MGFPTHGMQLIRVIDLEGAPIKVLPKQVGKLVNLRHLGLRNTKIKSVPSSVRKLSRLQSLDVRASGIEKMNSASWQIEALRELLVLPTVELNGIHPGSLKVLETPMAGDWMNNCLSRLANLHTLLLASVHRAPL